MTQLIPTDKEFFLTDGLHNYFTLALSKEGVSALTKTSYSRALRDYLDFLDRSNIEFRRAKTVDILSFIEVLKTQGLAVSSLNLKLTSIKRFYEFLESSTGFPNPAKKIKGIQEDRKSKASKVKHLTLMQANKVLKVAQTYPARDYAIINLLLRTGLRTIEVYRANIGDQSNQLSDDGSKRAILNVQGKGRREKDDFVVIPEKALESLNSYLATRENKGANDPLFTSSSIVKNSTTQADGRLSDRGIRKVVDKVFIKAKVKTAGLSAHSLRHTAATLLIESGVPLSEVSYMLRHENLSTTEIYTEVMKKQVRINHPTESKLDSILG